VRLALTIILFLFPACIALATPPPPDVRVIAFEWQRTVNGVAATSSSGKRLYWPTLGTSKSLKVPETADRRTWRPANSTEHYWIVLTDGRRLEIDKPTWCRLDEGSAYKE